MGSEPINFIGLATGTEYGIRNPRTTFYILEADAYHEDENRIIIV